ncbi:MAG TPA: fenitrothion hydrolase [Solirubrobacterales bacterium]|jgi:hypothetical protein|nr:fenitrothion hydrolase [Solirubrobacterales bacterium]
MIPIAHALLIGRRDLPIPEWLFAWAAAVVLVASFFALSMLWTKSRLEADTWHPASERISALLVNRVTELMTGLIGVALLAVVLWAGAAGTQLPGLNFAPTFVFITFWLGTVLVSVLFGDVFRAFNPWRAIGRAYGWGLHRLSGAPWRPPLRYPERLGRWPAALGLVAFAWLELIYGASNPAGLQPHDVAIATAVYTGYALAGMALFGTEVWLERGETFSVYFGMFSRLAPPEVRRGRLGLRRALAAATHWATERASVWVVVVAIGITAFDGAQEGLLSGAITSTTNALGHVGLGTTLSFRVAETFFLLVSVGAIGAIFWAGVVGMTSVRGSPAVGELGRLFAHTLIPIALAYLVAHYFSYFVFGQQAQFTYLLSDPLGNGSDYFGTSTGSIDYTALSAASIWYVQVGALVCGHVTGLALAHDRAIAIYGDPEQASRSQRWMLVVMVCFTCLGLFLLSQSNQ